MAAMRNASASCNVWMRRTGAIVVLAGMLAACAPAKVRPPAAPAQHAPAAAKAAPTQKTSSADASPYAQDTERLKTTLAKKSSEALGDDEVGYYMDVLQGRLRQSFAPPVHIVRKQQTIVVALDGGCDAAPRAQLDADALNTLAALAAVLKEYRKTVVSVQTHDVLGSVAPSDPEILERCALATARHLAAAGLGAKHVAVPGATSASAPATSTPAAQRVQFEVAIEPVMRASEH
jgi:outer membrane protein OmpA-like peptidoglycan-associated protein